MIPLAVPNLAGREAEYLQECIASTFVSSVGPFVDRFEAMVAKASGARYAVATSAGTTALHAALVACGVGRDDLVIVPSFTFIASVAAIAHAGAEPWLFDISPETWTIDPALVAKTLAVQTRRRSTDGQLIHEKSGKRVAGILPVYTLGVPADMDPIIALAKEYRLPVIADAAAALGTKYKSRPTGALGAEFTMFSFNGNKTVTAGGGGAIVTDDKKLAKLFRHLTTTARCSPDYDHDMVGFNYRMTNLQAAVGCAQLENLSGFLEAKRQIAQTYSRAFVSSYDVTDFPNPGFAEQGFWFSGLFLGRTYSNKAEDIRKYLVEAGIDARPFWKPVHLQIPYMQSFATPMTITNRTWQNILTLPCSTNLAKDEQLHVIDSVQKALVKFS
jgi:dTDP-4-amino-4,6-dideoxygalactose transaminase